MPYTTDSKNLPSNVLKMSASKRRQWVHIWNSAYDKYGDEEKAFRMANGGVKEGERVSVADYYKSVKVYQHAHDPDLPAHIAKLPGHIRRRWVDSHNYHMMENGESEAARKYADENTYLTLADIGLAKKADDSDHDYRTEDDSDTDDKDTKATDTKKKIADGKKEESRGSAFFFDAALSAVGGVKSFLGLQKQPSPWLIYKAADDRLRVLCFYSNCFKDKHKEILSEASHKEYVEYVEKSGNYPEFHLWHCGQGSKWADCDFVDYIDGFAVAGGYVVAGKEHVAEALAKQDNLKVSHGFFGLKDAEGTFSLYRSFEISPLPNKAEGNIWTAVSIGSKEFRMPFSEAKKNFLKSVGHNDDQIAGMESQAKEMSSKLKELGVEYKEDDPSEGVSSPDAGVRAAPGIEVVSKDLLSLGKAMTDMATAMSGFVKQFNELSAEFKTFKEASNKTVQEKAEELVTARIAGAVGAAGTRASENAGSVISKEKAEELAGSFSKEAGTYDAVDELLSMSGFANTAKVSGGN